MSAGEGQADWRMPIAAVVKANPTRVRLGALNTPMPAGYRQSGMDVTVRGSGWPSLDNREWRVSAWQDGELSTFPDLTLEGCDTTGEADAQPPHLATAVIEIRPTLYNHLRYPRPT